MGLLASAGLTSDQYAIEQIPGKGLAVRIAAKNPDTTEDPVLHIAHVDVRPEVATDLEATIDAFGNIRAKDPLSALGADNRAGLAIILSTIIALVREPKHEGEIRLLVTTGEEVGLGVLHAVQSKPFNQMLKNVLTGVRRVYSADRQNQTEKTEDDYGRGAASERVTVGDDGEPAYEKIESTGEGFMPSQNIEHYIDVAAPGSAAQYKDVTARVLGTQGILIDGKTSGAQDDAHKGEMSENSNGDFYHIRRFNIQTGQFDADKSTGNEIEAVFNVFSGYYAHLRGFESTNIHELNQMAGTLKSLVDNLSQASMAALPPPAPAAGSGRPELRMAANAAAAQPAGPVAVRAEKRTGIPSAESQSSSATGLMKERPVTAKPSSWKKTAAIQYGYQVLPFLIPLSGLFAPIALLAPIEDILTRKSKDTLFRRALRGDAKGILGTFLKYAGIAGISTVTTGPVGAAISIGIFLVFDVFSKHDWVKTRLEEQESQQNATNEPESVTSEMPAASVEMGGRTELRSAGAGLPVDADPAALSLGGFKNAGRYAERFRQVASEGLLRTVRGSMPAIQRNALERLERERGVSVRIGQVPLGKSAFYMETETTKQIVLSQKFVDVFNASGALDQAMVLDAMESALRHELRHALGGDEKDSYRETIESLKAADQAAGTSRHSAVVNELEFLLTVLANLPKESAAYEKALQILEATIEYRSGMDALIENVRSMVYGIDEPRLLNIPGVNNDYHSVKGLEALEAKLLAEAKSGASMEHRILTVNPKLLASVRARGVLNRLMDKGAIVMISDKEGKRLGERIFAISQLAASIGKDQFKDLMKQASNKETGYFSIAECLRNEFIQAVLNALEAQNSVAVAA